MTELSSVISRFHGHQDLLISQQWIPGCGDMWNPKCIISSANYIWFEKCYQNFYSRDSYCHDTCFSAIHHLPHAKCHPVWRRSGGQFVEHNKILYFMLLLCRSWLSSLFVYLAPVIFVLQLPFECYLEFFTVEIPFQYKNWVLPFEIFSL